MTRGLQPAMRGWTGVGKGLWPQPFLTIFSGVHGLRPTATLWSAATAGGLGVGVLLAPESAHEVKCRSAAGTRPAPPPDPAGRTPLLSQHRPVLPAPAAPPTLRCARRRHRASGRLQLSESLDEGTRHTHAVAPRWQPAAGKDPGRPYRTWYPLPGSQSTPCILCAAALCPGGPG